MNDCDGSYFIENLSANKDIFMFIVCHKGSHARMFGSGVITPEVNLKREKEREIVNKNTCFIIINILYDYLALFLKFNESPWPR